MPLYTTPDGRYTVAWETPGEGDGNSVIYDHWRGDPPYGLPVWDRFGYEAGLGEVRPPVVPSPVPSLPGPAPVTPLPEPATPLSRELRVFRVTEPRDGTIIPRMYSYWSNAYILGTTAYVFCGTDRGPQLLAVDLITGTVTRLGEPAPYGGETEGWFWLVDGSLIVLNGPTLVRCYPFNPAGGSTVVLDITDDHPGCDLWQPHSSDDGSTYSATVRRVVNDGPYPKIGTITIRRGRKFYDPAEGVLDESHLSGTGRDLIIEQDNNNKIINLDTRETRRIGDWDGALAHLDCGPDFMVGEADKPDPGQCALYYLDRPLTPTNKITLFLTLGMGHVSVKGGRCLLSDDTHLSLVSLNGGGVVQLRAHGGDVGGYDYQPKANLDPTGRVATYTIHKDGRYDVYLAVLPA